MNYAIIDGDALLPTDSAEYDILEEASRLSVGVDGMSAEIGVRAGGGSRMIINATLEAGSNRTHVMIDPWGNIEYLANEGRPQRCDYTNDMKMTFMINMHYVFKERKVNLIVFPMEDSEFFKRFGDYVPTYVNDHKKNETHYSMVHLDGPHDSAVVMEEVKFFAERMHPGAFLVCDDTHMYDHYDKCHEPIISLGFVEHRRGQRKISYKKI